MVLRRQRDRLAGAAGRRGGFRDDSIAYATKLGRAGVPVELLPGVPHEFDFFAFESSVARRAMADRIRVLRSI